jgi:hypothetical protein
MNTDVLKLKDKVLEIIEKGKDLAVELTKPEAWDSLIEVNENVNEIMGFLLYVITETEAAVRDINKDIKLIKSTEKREAVVAALDEAIQLPWYAEMFDDVVIRMAIDKGVEYLNNKFGKEWDLDEIRQYLEKLKGDLNQK